MFLVPTAYEAATSSEFSGPPTMAMFIAPPVSPLTESLDGLKSATALGIPVPGKI